MAKYHNWQDLMPSIRKLLATPEGYKTWESLKEKANDVVTVVASAPEDKLKKIETDSHFKRAAESLAKVVKTAVRLSPTLDPHTKDLATLAIEIKLLEINQKRKAE